MAELDLGTLAGKIELEDKGSAALKLFVGELEKSVVAVQGFSKQVEKSMSVTASATKNAGSSFSLFSKIAIGSLAGVAASVGGYVTAVVKLGETGSKIAGVEKAFERLAAQAGTTGKALFEGLNKGVHATVDSMELMQGANRALSAGVKLTAKDMETLGETARAMGQAAGTDTANELDTLFRALTTGQTRMLKMKGIIVDTKKAEEEFAKSIGTTADQLNQAGKTEAARIGMMKAFEERLKTLGKAELTFSERLKQSQVIIGDWWDSLAKAINSSPALNAALEDISEGLKKAFEEHGPKAIAVLVGIIEKVAEGFRALVPYVTDAVKWLGQLWDWIVKLNDNFDITGKIVDTVKIAFEGLKTTIVFLADLAVSFWNNLVALNDRFGITDKIARAAVVAFNFLKVAFDLLKGAAAAVMTAWSAMPGWLQQITSQALTAAIALGAIGLAAKGLASPMAQFADAAKNAVSFWSSFTGAIRNSIDLVKTLTKVTWLQTAATSAWNAINLITTPTMVWLNVATFTLGNTIPILTARVWLLEASEKVQLVTSKLLTAIKLGLAAAYLWVSESALVTTLRTWAMNAAEIVATRTGLTLTAASTGLAVAIASVAASIALVAAAFYAGWKAGEWIGEVSGLTDWFGKLSASVGEFFGFLPEGTSKQYDAMRAADKLRESNEKLAGSFDAVAEARRNMDRDFSGEKLANETNELLLSYQRLVQAGKDTPEALQRIGDAALALQNRGANLHRELDILAASAKLVNDAAVAVVPPLKQFTIENNSAAEAAKATAEALKAQAAAIDQLKGIDVVLEGYKALGLAMSAFKGGGTFEELKDLPLESITAFTEKLEKAITLMKAKDLPIPDEMLELHANALKAKESTAALTAEIEKSEKAAKMWAGSAEQAALSADSWRKASAQAKAELQAIKDLIGKTDFNKINIALTGVSGALTQINPKLNLLTSSWEELDAAFKKMDLDELKRQFEAIQKEVEGMRRRGEQIPPVYQAAVAAMAGYFSRLQGALKNLTKVPIAIIPKLETSGFDKAVKTWDTGLKGMAQGFVDLAEIAGDSFGGIVKWIAKTAQAMVIAREAGKQMKEGMTQMGGGIDPATGKPYSKTEGAVNMAQGVIGGISAIDAATQNTSKTKNIIGGGMAGAQAGLAFGPWGAAVGFAVGAIVGAARKPQHVKVMEEIGREWGVDISEGLAKQIESDMKGKFKGMKNNRWLAEVFNLGNIISEVGLSVDNMSSLNNQLRQAFVFLDEGAMTVKDVAKVLDESFGQFTEYYTERNSKISKSLREIIKLDREMAVHSKAVMDFVKGQTADALQRIGSVIVARGNLVDKLKDAQTKLNDLMKEGKGKDNAEQIKAATAEVAKLQEQLKVLPLTLAGAKGIGSALFGMFSAQVEAGESAFDVLKGMQPVVESFTNQLVGAGLNGGAAFDKLRNMVLLTTDEIAGPGFQAVHDYTEGLKALHNADILDQEMFSGLSEQISATYNAAVAALVAQGKDTSAALGLVAPDLQVIWELQQDMGYTVDETTQKLLNEAIAAGQVGDAHRSVQDQMLAATEKIQFAVEGLARAFGVIIPEAAKTGAQGIEDAMIGAADITAEQALQMESAIKQALLDSKAYGLDAGQTIGEALKQAGITAVSKDGIGKIIEMLKGLPGWAELSALGIEEALNSIKVDDINIGTNVETPEIPTPRNMPGGEQGGQGYMTGGMVAQYASRGNLIQFPKYAASGRFMSGPRGTDTVPTWLTPGEFVIKKPSVDKIGVAKLKEINDQGSVGSGGGQTVVEGPMPIIVLVSTGSEDADVDMILRALPSVIKNKRQVRSKLREAIGLSTKAAEKAS